MTSFAAGVVVLAVLARAVLSAGQAASPALESLLGTIPAGDYHVQRWVPPAGSTQARFFYLVTAPTASRPVLARSSFVTDLGVQTRDAVVNDVRAHANPATPRDVVVEPLTDRDGTVLGFVVRERSVWFWVDARDGRPVALYVDEAETAQSGGGGGGGGM